MTEQELKEEIDRTPLPEPLPELPISFNIITHLKRIDELADLLNSLPKGSEAIIVGNEQGTERKITFEGEENYNGVQLRVYRYTYVLWSFSDARNIARQYSTREWCMWLDSDDILLPTSEYERLSEIPSGIAGLICGCFGYSAPYADVHGGFYVTPQLRIFRRNEKIKWKGIIHEQLLPQVEKEYLQTKAVPIMIQHNGYDTDIHVMYAKCKRNVELLIRQLATDKEFCREYYESALATTISEKQKLETKIKEQQWQV